MSLRIVSTLRQQYCLTRQLLECVASRSRPDGPVSATNDASA
jgi:hypothetical protein